VARKPKLYGYEEPRLFTPPLRPLTPETSRGFEVIAFAEDVLGLTLNPWQKWLYIHALELRPDGRYRFRTLVILVARQNGKTTWLQILALWALYVDAAQLVLGTAQNLDVAEECWAGAVDMAESIPELAAEVKAVDRTNGKKALRLTTGERYKVAAASRGGGRGMSAKIVVLDELREHRNWDAWGAITKTTMARKDALIVGLSNAGDVLSVVLSHLRKTALADIEAGEDSSLGLFEWSAPEGAELTDRSAWQAANPSLGYTIEEDAIVGALKTDTEGDAAVFRTEVLCQWVKTTLTAYFPGDKWADCRDEDSELPEGASLVFGVDVSWDRSTSHIAVVGRRADGVPHWELVTSDEGTDWVPEWFRTRRYAPLAVALQGGSAPSASLVEPLKKLGLPVEVLSGTNVATATGAALDAITAGSMRHIGQAELEAAVAVAQARELGDGKALDRKKSPVDIAGLVAVVEAAWVLDSLGLPDSYDPAASVH
jgi:phage terminase large subunit-like protein